MTSPLPEKEAGLPAPLPLADPATMPEEFSRSTMLALRAQQEILDKILDPADENYGAELRAKSMLAAAQINAQLKADEQKLKRQVVQLSFYKELNDKLAAFHAARRVTHE